MGVPKLKLKFNLQVNSTSSSVISWYIFECRSQSWIFQPVQVQLQDLSLAQNVKIRPVILLFVSIPIHIWGGWSGSWSFSSVQLQLQVHVGIGAKCNVQFEVSVSALAIKSSRIIMIQSRLGASKLYLKWWSLKRIHHS